MNCQSFQAEPGLYHAVSRHPAGHCDITTRRVSQQLCATPKRAGHGGLVVEAGSIPCFSSTKRRSQQPIIILAMMKSALYTPASAGSTMQARTVATPCKCRAWRYAGLAERLMAAVLKIAGRKPRGFKSSIRRYVNVAELVDST